MRSLIVFSVAALGLLACTSEETPTDPTAGAKPEMAVAKTYTAVDLGVAGASTGQSGLLSFSSASDINDAGQVVGLSTPVGCCGGRRGDPLFYHAFLWEKGVMTDLGTLGGNFSIATGINPAGKVVGWSFILPYGRHSFLWTNGLMTDLGTLGGPESVAADITPAGQVLGLSQIGGGISAPDVFLWDKGVMTDLGIGVLFLESGAGINPAGRVVAGGVLWDNGVVTDLGTLGGCCTAANAINPAGQVVGYSYLPGNEVYHAFVWERGVMTDLGTLGGNSSAFDINSRGQIVGQSADRAFVWEKGVMTALVSLDRRFPSSATAINDAGQMVGVSTTERGGRATLWTRK